MAARDRPPRRRRSRRAGRAARAVPIPASPALHGAVEERHEVAATLNVNGKAYPVELEPGTTACSPPCATSIGLTGSKEGCDDSECGACMMLLDGKPVNACSYLALQAEGREITTVEGLAGDDALHPLQARVPRAGRRPVRVLHARHADLGDRAARRQPERRPRTRSASRSSGNLCRCTGYDGIVKAVMAVAAERRA